VRDLWPESIVTLGVLKQGRIIRLLEKLEIGLYGSATRIVTISEPMRERIAAYRCAGSPGRKDRRRVERR
jgi:hypothetical protein